MPPTPNRNAPCPCGSGKKYKQCCAIQGGVTAPRAENSGAPRRTLGLLLGAMVFSAAGYLTWRSLGEDPGQEGSAQETPSSEGAAENLAAAAAPRASAQLTPEESHARMLSDLAELAKGADDSHPYLGRGRADQIEAALGNLDANAPPRQRWELNFAAGEAELQLGNLQAAIGFLEAADALLPIEGLEAQAAAYTKFKLGVAWMRLGETQNCCARNQPESCILPLRGGALHTKTEGSTRAIEYFEQVLDANVDAVQTGGGLSNAAPTLRMSLAARWLLNLAYMTLDRYPADVPSGREIPTESFESSVEFPRFENVAKSVGLDTFTLCGGMIADDFDGDGYLDVIASTWDPEGGLRYFHNERDGSFSDQSESAGLTGLYGGLNCVQADYDNDGHLDVLVLRGAWLGSAGRHPNSLLHNNGDGSFTDVTHRAGLAEVSYPTQTAGWADYDRDGDLDLFIGNESTPQLASPLQLFRNEGDGTFVDVATAAGMTHSSFAKGCSWGDYDGDGYPDLFVSNYGGPNRLYHNEGDGTFVDAALAAGVHLPITSFPTWFWDYDNDGNLDLFVSSYTGRIDHVALHYLGEPPTYEQARLYKGDGAGGFVDVSTQAGLRYPMLPMGANFGDLDNDGFLDLYLGTGDPDFASLMPNLMFKSQGGERFVDVTMAGGFGHLQKGHAIAFADLDNDGDADVLEQMGGAFRGDEYGDALFENPGFGGAWIGLALEGRESNRAAIGARLHVRSTGPEGERSVYRHVTSGGSFGANPLRQTLGLGQAERVLFVEIDWPSDAPRQVLEDPPLGRYLKVVEGQPGFEVIELEALTLGD